MQQYQQLLQRILALGGARPDRTGVGTLSLFGEQLRFDLRAGFPLCTTKKMFWKGIVHELLWMIAGRTDLQYLHDQGVHIWDPWALPDGTIGPGYGKQLRRVEVSSWVTHQVYDKPEVSGVPDATVFGIGSLGSYDREDPQVEMLKTTWREMLRRCYYEPSLPYPGYGGKGVHVVSSWLEFPAFQRDASRLPNWNMKLEYPDEYSLDKDILQASNRYGPDTCMWASHEEQSLNTSTKRPFTAKSPTGEVTLFYSFGDAVRREGLNQSAVHRCLNGALHTHHGWSEFSYLEQEGQVLQTRIVDQLRQVIASIKHEPQSRRHIITFWNPGEVDEMALPPCHGNIIQFYVGVKGSLSCHMYQRSADALLGLPWNIASYALLTHLVAQVTGLYPEKLIISFGDVHLYQNHVSQAREVLSRPPYPLPSLTLSPSIKDIDSFCFEDLTLIGYRSHPTIPAPIAV